MNKDTCILKIIAVIIALTGTIIFLGMDNDNIPLRLFIPGVLIGFMLMIIGVILFFKMKSIEDCRYRNIIVKKENDL